MNAAVRASARVLRKRMLPITILLALLCAILWVALMGVMPNLGASSAPGAMAAWRIASAAGLLFFGALLAGAVGEVMRTEDAIWPARRRALSRAAWHTGTQAWAVTALLGGALAWRLRIDVPLLVLLAEPSAALACGVATVSAALHRQRHAWFVPIALLPLVAQLTPPRGVIETSASAWLWSAWLLAWPTCAWILHRAVSRTRGTPRRLPSMAQPLVPQSALRRAWSHAHLESMLGNAAWLLRPTPTPLRIRDLLVRAALVGGLLLATQNNANVLRGFIFAAAGSWWMAAFEQLRHGVRPTMLLLPGQRIRPRLAMLVFTEAVRSGLPVLGLVGAVWFVGVCRLPWQWAWTTALAMAILFGGGALALAWMVALRAWLRPTIWRGTVQALPGLMATATGVLLAVWWIDEAPTSEPAFVLMGALLSVGLVATAIGFVRLSAPAWARQDIHNFARPNLDRGLFDPPA